MLFKCIRCETFTHVAGHVDEDDIPCRDCGNWGTLVEFILAGVDPMASKEYKAVSNFFRNTMGITRKEVKELLREVFREIVAEEFGRFMKETAGQAVVNREAKAAIQSFIVSQRAWLADHVLTVLLKKVGGQ